MAAKRKSILATRWPPRGQRFGSAVDPTPRSELEHSILVDTENLMMAFIRTRKREGWLQFLTF